VSDRKPFSYDDLFPERWLHAEDLKGQEVTLTITAAYAEDLRLPSGTVNAAGVLSFKGTHKEYVLNKTNAMVLVGLWGKDSAEYVGKRITIAAVPDTSGKSASGLRILFVGSPDIDRDTPVPQPLNKTRGIKKTSAQPRKGGQDATATHQATPMPKQGQIDEMEES
jgi:hypothetical protein